jgi:hypothetical protein
VPIDRVKVSGPILVVSSELDHLTPPAIGRSLATFYGPIMPNSISTQPLACRGETHWNIGEFRTLSLPQRYSG